MNWLEKIADWGWQAFIALATAVVAWVFYIERRIAGLRLHVSETYVKKQDLQAMKEEIADQFREVKDSQSQILDILLNQKIGTSAKYRRR